MIASLFGIVPPLRLKKNPPVQMRVLRRTSGVKCGKLDSSYWWETHKRLELSILSVCDSYNEFRPLGVNNNPEISKAWIDSPFMRYVHRPRSFDIRQPSSDSLATTLFRPPVHLLNALPHPTAGPTLYYFAGTMLFTEYFLIN